MIDKLNNNIDAQERIVGTANNRVIANTDRRTALIKELASIQTHINSSGKAIETDKARVKTTQAAVNAADNTIKNIRDSIDSDNKTARVFSGSKARLERQYDQANNIYQRNKDTVAADNATRALISGSLSKAKTEVEAVDKAWYNLGVNNFSMNPNDYLNLLTRYRDAHGAIDKLIAQLASANSILASDKKELDTSQVSVSQIQDSLRDINNMIKAINKEIDDDKIRVSSAERDLATLQKALDAANSQLSSNTKANSILMGSSNSMSKDLYQLDYRSFSDPSPVPTKYENDVDALYAEGSKLASLKNNLVVAETNLATVNSTPNIPSNSSTFARIVDWLKTV